MFQHAFGHSLYVSQAAAALCLPRITIEYVTENVNAVRGFSPVTVSSIQPDLTQAGGAFPFHCIFYRLNLEK
jgi:hypothetical protein